MSPETPSSATVVVSGLEPTTCAPPATAPSAKPHHRADHPAVARATRCASRPRLPFTAPPGEARFKRDEDVGECRSQAPEHTYRPPAVRRSRRRPSSTIRPCSRPRPPGRRSWPGQLLRAPAVRAAALRLDASCAPRHRGGRAAAVGRLHRRPDGRLSPRSINTIVGEIGRLHDAQMPNLERRLGTLRPHDARHTFAFSLSQASGHNRAEVERRLGHANDRYLRLYTNPPDDIAAGYIEDL
ncbi:tyrosine-type recombinase/integrase [Nonomuraea terrae]|uniref:tyrosine-type recombinase/integrase n=1 Tax=Nonomuraea terrae TaxID=2530383 RepID=UPI0037AA0FA6